MPFDLYVSRAPTYAAMRGEPSPPPRPGLLSRILSKEPPASAPITRDEFHAVMKGAPAAQEGEHLYWLRHADGDPWFAAEWRDDGNVVLSTSYSNHRFLRNFADMFDQGLRMAEKLKARLYEEVGGREVTARNIDALLEPSGSYIDLQVGTFRHVLEQMSSEPNAPLEFPLGPIDLVSEYLLFHVRFDPPLSDAAGADLLGDSIAGADVHAVGAGAWVVVERDGKTALTRVLHRPDGTWQVWPAWGQAPFARIGQVTLAVAETLADSGRGQIELDGLPCDAALRREVRSRIATLGVDFYRWTLEVAPAS